MSIEFLQATGLVIWTLVFLALFLLGLSQVRNSFEFGNIANLILSVVFAVIGAWGLWALYH